MIRPQLLALVGCAAVLVHAPVHPSALAASPPGARSAPAATTIHTSLDELTPQAREMHEALQSAARSGVIENLLAPFDWNELPPTVGEGPPEDLVAAIRELSADGSGLDVLARLALVMSLPFAVLPLGPDVENSRVFVFPYLAAMALGELTPAQRVELYSVVPPTEAAGMLTDGRYRGMAVVIGADGTWHALSPNGIAKK